MVEYGIGQTIHDVCELSKMTKVPFLLMGNPGYGKTTSINNYAKAHGYHMECVIGSRSTPEELLGYQVNNGGESLEHLDSQWWKRIIDKKAQGIPSILFCDEVSTCSPQVQGSMFSLVLDRKNNKGEMLPDDCIVIAAANYAGNLSSYMDILPPMINRFCVINLTDRMNGTDIVDTLFGKEKVVARNIVKMSKDVEAQYDSKIEQFLKNLFIQYSDKGSSKGYIDINNTNLDGIYQDAVGCLYNFISMRSLSNLRQLVKGSIEAQIGSDVLTEKMVDGLIGLGTRNFREEAQATAYRSACYSAVKSIVKQVSNLMRKELGGGSVDKKEKFKFGERTVSVIAAELGNSAQRVSDLVSSGDEVSSLASELVSALEKYYRDYAETLFQLDGNQEIQARFLSDYESLGTVFTTHAKVFNAEDCAKVVSFLQRFSAYYSQLSGYKKIPDMNKQKVFERYKSSTYKCAMIAVKPSYDRNGNIPRQVNAGNIIEVGVRRLESNTLYKITYGSGVSAASIGTPVSEDYKVLMFEDGKLVEVDQRDIIGLK